MGKYNNKTDKFNDRNLHNRNDFKSYKDKLVNQIDESFNYDSLVQTGAKKYQDFVNKARDAFHLSDVDMSKFRAENKEKHDGVTYGEVEGLVARTQKSNEDNADYGWGIEIYESAPATNVCDKPKDTRLLGGDRKGFVAEGYESEAAAMSGGVDYVNSQIEAYGYGWAIPDDRGFLDVYDKDGNKLFNVYLVKSPSKERFAGDDGKPDKEAVLCRENMNVELKQNVGTMRDFQAGD